MKKFALLFVGTIFALAAHAQLVQDSLWTIEEYDWEEVPQKETREFITKQEEVIIKNVQLLQMRYDDESAALYELTHRRIWIGDEKVIQSYNKLYLPLNESNDAKTIKARVLLPNGNVVNLDDADVQEGKDEDGNTYRYFALDGVQVGSIVEYLFLTEEQPGYLGTRFTLQRSVPIYDLQFELVVPYNLIFKIKSYNALHQPQNDTVLKYQNRYYIHQDTLPKFEKEEASFDRPYMGYLIYALDRNLFSGKRDISSFGYSSANIFKNVHLDVDKKTIKGFKKILADSKYEEEKDDLVALARIENYLKENFFITKNGTQALYDILSILETHAMNEFGALRLYHNLFAFAGYPNQIVLTTPKSNTPFDPDFENNLMIRDDFLYFTNQDIFMSPTEITSRLGYFDDDFRNTKALFVEAIDLGNGLEGIGEIGDIPALSAKSNRTELTVDWTLEPDGEAGKVSIDHKLYGMQAGYFQTISKFVGAEDMDKFKKAISENLYSEVDFQEYTIKNMEGANFPSKPLIVETYFSDEAYTEPSSTSTIIKVGEIIGPQSEMYFTDSVRKLPVHHGFPRQYDRKITLHVPDGYVLKNTESLKMNVASEGDAPLMKFTSNYSYANNVLEINITEWYEQSDYPVEMFDIYRAVVNAAADFNKKYLVLEKQP